MRAVTIVLLAVCAMAFAQNEAPNILPDSAFYRPSVGPAGQVVIANPDPGFYRPSNPGQQQPSVGPTFVNNRPAKQFNDPNLRGGK